MCVCVSVCADTIRRANVQRADNHTVYLREKRESVCVSADTIRRANAQRADNHTVYLREKRERVSVCRHNKKSKCSDG